MLCFHVSFLRFKLITATLHLCQNTSAVKWHSPVDDCVKTVFINKDLKKVPFLHLGQVYFLVVQVQFHSHLPDGQCIGQVV